MIASSLLELKLKGSEKLGYDSSENVSALRIVLESDGTEVEDDGYFQTAEKDTIFILLKSNETWLPLGVDALKSALLTLPGLVSDSLNKLEASDRLPNWKVSDHSGIITVVLSWDTRDRMDSHLELSSASPIPIGPALAAAPLYLEQEIMESLGWTSSSGQAGEPGRSASSEPGPSTSHVPTTGGPTTTQQQSTSLQEQQQQLLQEIQRQQQEILQQQQILAQQAAAGQQPVPQQSRSKLTLDGLSPVTGLPTCGTRVIPTIQHQYVSFDSDSDEDMSDKDEEASPVHEDHTHCDFHCSNLHRQMQLIKKCSVATSPIQESVLSFGSFASGVPFMGSFTSSRGVSPTGKKTGSGAGKYVRFQDMEGKNKAGLLGHDPTLQVIESDSESTSMMEEEQTSERYLLLVDQVGGHGHLSIKDIGIILEKLSSKIVDVDKLEREKESSDVYNWIIRAAIKGDALKEVGVIYNDTYYGIMEHPGYF